MRTTRIAVAQDELVAILKDRPELQGVPVDLGYPVDGVKREHIWIPGDADVRQSYDTTGEAEEAEKEETFTLKVLVHVKRMGADYAATRNRALELIGEVEEILRETDNLNEKVFEVNLGRLELADGVVPNERMVMAVLHVNCTAYI